MESQTGASYTKRSHSGESMTVMTPAAHAKPVPKHDHLWVLAVVAAAVLAEVWASWVGIGAMSGFPRIDDVPTDWVLAVAVEAYWGYALFAWLAAAPGPRSRTMAMWSCAVVFALSLVSQVSYHELTAPAGATPGRRFVIGFASALPVVILGLIAILVHLRHVDRAEAAEAAERERMVTAEAERIAAEAAERAQAEAAAADDRTALRAELDAARAAQENAQADLQTARAELSRMAAKTETLTRKLAAATKPKRAPVSDSRTSKSTPENAQAEDLSTELRALKAFDEHPELRAPRMGGELARELGVSPATGRRLHARLTAQDRSGEPLTERSAERPDERSGERS